MAKEATARGLVESGERSRAESGDERDEEMRDDDVVSDFFSVSEAWRRPSAIRPALCILRKT